MSNSTLKWIAIISMLVDHMGAVLFPQVIVFRAIGRLAFPIFAFLITEGFIHTQNINKYIMRLGVFALVSEIPFNLAFYGRWFYLGHQNIFVTLFLGLLAITLYEKYRVVDKQKADGYLFLMLFGAFIINSDYSIFGVLMIFVFYIFKKDFKKIVIWNVIIVLSMVLPNWAANAFILNPWLILQLGALVSLYIIHLYNGKKGKQIKYLFYMFYPVHLIFLYIASLNFFF
ncbi:TraX protein [Natranaerovirga pectinivora]|uniref:TraX protein n=1 Tax=Natranaerovirga pectinivora TaxID=682400 RepID=A0A4R3MNF8_9FIRM|nr:TraX family protein [Natranaerovirga pectinivora]TCT16751.1 TraX protein [Natranaerovirga pectinivora]